MDIPCLNEPWRLWRDASHEADFNMAADEALLLSLPENSRPVLRIYGWSEPKAVSIGFAQRWGITPPEYRAVRRPTGGGVVFHDADMTYTLVFPSGHLLEKCSREESYAYIHAALAQEMARDGLSATLLPESVPDEDHARMQCFVSPSRFDVMNGSEKYAGAAQRRSREGLLHQGSIKRSVTGGNLERLQALTEKAFEDFFGIEYVLWQPDERLMESIEVLREKYVSERWSVHRRAPLRMIERRFF